MSSAHLLSQFSHCLPYTDAHCQKVWAALSATVYHERNQKETLATPLSAAQHRAPLPDKSLSVDCCLFLVLLEFICILKTKSTQRRCLCCNTRRYLKNQFVIFVHLAVSCNYQFLMSDPGRPCPTTNQNLGRNSPPPPAQRLKTHRLLRTREGTNINEGASRAKKFVPKKLLQNNKMQSKPSCTVKHL